MFGTERNNKVMKNVVEAVKNGQSVTIEELFSLANKVMCTQVTVISEENETILGLMANRCEQYNGRYEFFQSGTFPSTSMYKVKSSSITSMKCEYSEEADSIFARCILSDGNTLVLQFWYVSESPALHDCAELELIELKEFLDDTLANRTGYSCMCVTVTDMYGMNLKMYTNRVYINTSNDDEWKLHISDNSSTFEIPVVEDAVNEFYVKYDGSSQTIIVKPYGQPFTQIEMLFICNR